MKSRMTRRSRVAIFSASFPPSYQRGGPARSLGAMTERLGEEFGFHVITSAMDDPADGPMPGIEVDVWSSYAKAEVWHESNGRPSARRVRQLLRTIDPDVVYLNSLFDASFSLLPLVVVRLFFRKLPIVLAPRGELSPGALSIRSFKKRCFLAAFRILRLHRTVTWHASTEIESDEISLALSSSFFGSPPHTSGHQNLRTSVALDPSPISQVPEIVSKPIGKRLSMVFFSRIVPKKNLDTLLRALAVIPFDLNLTIAGPLEDHLYWAKCQKLIDDLPLGKRVEHVGPVAAEDVPGFLANFDLFVLPTLGENFGHVILEALAASVPVVVGRDTPWETVPKVGAGWLCDPLDAKQIAGQIIEFHELSPQQREFMRNAARGLAIKITSDPETDTANRMLFRSAIARKPLR